MRPSRFVQELQEVEILTGYPVGRGLGEDQEAERAGPDIRALFEEKCSPAVLDFPRSAGVGRTVPRGRR